MTRRLLLVVASAFMAAPALAAPPIQTPMMANARLRAAKTGPQAKAAVAAVSAACRGKFRRAFRDNAGLLSTAKKMSGSKDPAVRRAALDLDACFSARRFVAVVGPRVSDEAPEVLTYAAEVAARMADPVVVAPLLAALDARAGRCLAPGLAAPEIEVCVWLTYAPGAALEAADTKTREAAASRAVKMFAAPYAKVREVAVETVASARLKAHAKAVGALIADEKAGKFADKNDPALLKRFDKRRRALLGR